MRDHIRIGVVNFTPVWGDREASRKKMEVFIREAAERKAELLVFPECAVTGNDIDFGNLEHPMQRELAEPEDGETVGLIRKLAEETGMYIAFGMPERRGEQVYNSLFVVSAQGVEAVYRKIHPYGYENCWCAPGKNPVIWDSPWGPIGLGVCYDTYQFPELIRYYSACGCRLYVSVTAQCESRKDPRGEEKFRQYYWTTQAASVITNDIFIASANVTGVERFGNYGGASTVMGPEEKENPYKDPYCKVWAGGLDFKEEGIAMAEVDLSLSVRSYLREWAGGFAPVFCPEQYAAWYEALGKM